MPLATCLLSTLQLLTLIRHLSGFGTPGCTQCGPGWDHGKVPLAPLQLPGGLPPGTAGSLALLLLEPVTCTCAYPDCCPGNADPCPAALQALFPLLIPPDIWPGCQQRPALLCVCAWLGTADIGTRRQDSCSRSLLGAPEVLPGPAAW